MLTQDAGLVADLIVRKRAEGAAVPDANFPHVAALTCFKCWDATEYEEEDEGVETTRLSLEADLDAAGTKALLDNRGVLFSPGGAGFMLVCSARTRHVYAYICTHNYHVYERM